MIATLSEFKELSKSKYGHKRYYLIFTDNDYNILEGKTCNNFGITGGLPELKRGVKYDIKFHMTNAGNMVFDKLVMKDEKSDI